MIKPMTKILRFILPNWVSGITLAPFGIYIDLDKPFDDLTSVVNHEEIHWRQQIEMFIIPFYLWYSVEWFLKLFKYGGQAYMNISFEREAYNWNNLYDRQPFNWVRYL